MSLYQYRLIRAALIYLAVTGLLGVLFHLSPLVAAYFRTTHVHLGVIGFFLSMVMGVAYWMMPRPGQLRQEGSEAATFYFLNAGLILRFFAEPAWRYTGEAWLNHLTVLAALLQFAAILVFVFAMRKRVKTADMIKRLRSGARQRV